MSDDGVSVHTELVRKGLNRSSLVELGQDVIDLISPQQDEALFRRHRMLWSTTRRPRRFQHGDELCGVV